MVITHSQMGVMLQVVPQKNLVNKSRFQLFDYDRTWTGRSSDNGASSTWRSWSVSRAFVKQHPN